MKALETAFRGAIQSEISKFSDGLGGGGSHIRRYKLQYKHHHEPESPC